MSLSEFSGDLMSLLVMSTQKRAAFLLMSLAGMGTMSDKIHAADLPFRARAVVEREAPLSPTEQRRQLFEEFLHFLKEKARISHQ
jgi:hypothetical protein